VNRSIDTDVLAAACARYGPPVISDVRPQNPTSGSHTCRPNSIAQRLYRFLQSRELPEPSNRRISIELPSGASTDPELLARFIFSHQAPWISSLIAVRDAIVGRVGLKAQATHVTWCSERDRPSRHRQDLQHRFDRNSPWPSGSTGMRRHWQHRARSRARDSLGDLIPLRRFARRRTSRSAWRQHGRLR
jgi:Protein of unknown function (DUF2867)